MNDSETHRRVRSRSQAALLALASLVTVAGCDRAPPPAPAAPPPRNVDVVQLEATAIPMPWNAVGRTESSQRVEIRARVNGFLDEIAYTEGTLVEEGEVLFRIDPAPFEARVRASEAELAQQRARLDNAEALLARIQPLADANAVAQKELDDATGGVREAAAAVEAAEARLAEAQLDLGYTTILSPLDGLSNDAAERQGAYISGTSGALTTIVRLDPIWVEFSVSETDALRKNRDEQSGLIVFPENDDDYEVEITLADGTKHPHVGRISYADASINDSTGTFRVRAEVPNPEQRLHPGQFVSVKISGPVRPNAIVVPQRAVRQGAKGASVWVVNANGAAEQRPVIAGPWTESGWIIDKGLRAGDRVIVNGSLGLVPNAPVNIVGISRTGDPDPTQGR